MAPESSMTRGPMRCFVEHKPTKCFFYIEQWDILLEWQNQDEQSVLGQVSERPRPISARTHPSRLIPLSHGVWPIRSRRRTISGGCRGSGDEVAIGPRAEAGRLDLCEWGAERLRAAVGSCRSFCERSPSDGRCTGGRGGSALRRLRRARQDALRAVFPGQHPLDEMRKPRSAPDLSSLHTFDPLLPCASEPSNSECYPFFFVPRITARLLLIPTSSASSWYGGERSMPCNFVVWDMSAAHLVLDWSLDIACSFCRSSWLIWSCTRQGRTAIFCLISWAWDRLLTRYKSMLSGQTLIVASPYWKHSNGFGSYEYSQTAFFADLVVLKH